MKSLVISRQSLAKKHFFMMLTNDYRLMTNDCTGGAYG
jgi:hypothetical protein